MNSIETQTQPTNTSIVRRYLAALEQGATGADLAEFFHPQVAQEEFPNRITPNGARRDLAGLLEASERGKKVMAGQRYEIRKIVGSGDIVMFEALWSGTLLVALGTLNAGDIMRANIASVIELRHGKIIAQRSYDCFEPW